MAKLNPEQDATKALESVQNLSGDQLDQKLVEKILAELKGSGDTENMQKFVSNLNKGLQQKFGDIQLVEQDGHIALKDSRTSKIIDINEKDKKVESTKDITQDWKPTNKAEQQIASEAHRNLAHMLDATTRNDGSGVEVTAGDMKGCKYTEKNGKVDTFKYKGESGAYGVGRDDKGEVNSVKTPDGKHEWRKNAEGKWDEYNLNEKSGMWQKDTDKANQNVDLGKVAVDKDGFHIEKNGAKITGQSHEKEQEQQAKNKSLETKSKEKEVHEQTYNAVTKESDGSYTCKDGTKWEYNKYTQTWRHYSTDDRLLGDAKKVEYDEKTKTLKTTGEIKE